MEPPFSLQADPPLSLRRERWWLHALLLVLTFLTTTWAGFYFAPNAEPWLLRGGPLTRDVVVHLAVRGCVGFALPLLAILFAHEMGHYLLCLKYRLDASPPYFIPFPPLFVNISGTFGAFMRIRQQFRTRRELFDVGVGGPIAGFVVTLPILAYGIVHTQRHVAPTEPGSIVFGYPLAIILMQKLLLGTTFTSYDVYEHPALMAGWFGLLVTALNLLPVGQLDGGHAVYAVLGRHHRKVAFSVLALLAIAGIKNPGWWVLAILFVALAGLRHPPVIDEEQPIGGGRKTVLGIVALMFVLCLAPEPISEAPRSGPGPLRPPPERSGTVVHELHLHGGAENARGHRNPVGAQRGDEADEQRLGHIPAGGALEAGAPPA